jgi:probable phosphoglycerate mutase
MLWVRHGETAVNAAGLLLGRGDPPLTALGHEQVAATAVLVAAAHPRRILTSPLGRARETAAILAAACGGIPVEVDERAIELDYGDWEGRRLSELPPDEVLRWRADVEFRPPRGESLADVGRRVAVLSDELVATEGARVPGRAGHGRDGLPVDDVVVVVSHVSPIKAAACWAVGIDQSAAWRLHLALASITRLGVRGGVAFLERFNEVPSAAGHRPS